MKPLVKILTTSFVVVLAVWGTSAWKNTQQPNQPAPTAVPTPTTHSLAALLPTAPTIGELMRIGGSDEIEKIAMKLQQAATNDKKWFLEYLEAHPNKPLPYHQRLGVTEEEYKLFIDSSNQKIEKYDEVEFSFEQRDASTYILRTNDPQLAHLDNLELDFAQNTVKIKQGLLTEHSFINNTNPDAPTGPWRGEQWKLEKLPEDISDIASAHRVVFALGELQTDENKGILYFDLKSGTEGNLSTIIFFDIPKRE